MIAKRVPRGKAGNFKRLGHYIVGGASVAVSGQPLQAMPGEPASQAQPGEAEVWTRTAEYIVDAAGGGARTAAVRISNCAASDVEMAIAEILATQSKNVRAKGDRTYHLVVAFPPGEKPALEQLRDIEDELCKAIGFAKHQRLSAVHIDTEHLHLHVAINQVHPETLCLIEPWQDRHKLMRACDRLEIKHNLTRTNHGKKHGERHARSVGAMEAADGPKVEGVPQEPLPARAQAMERHSGEISLLSWIRQEVRPNLEATLANVTSWQDLHKVLGAHGLEIRPRGAGLILTETENRVSVKASSVDRRLAMKALVTRLGAFVRPERAATAAATVNERQAKRNYRRRPMHEGKGVEPLYAIYQRRRGEAVAAREAALTDNTDANARYKVWYDNRFKAIITDQGWTQAGKNLELARLKADYAGIRLDLTLEAREERKKHPVPTWQEFLMETASQGNGMALAALRRLSQRRRQAFATLLAGVATDAATNVIFGEFRPRVLPNGDVVYRMRDGGIIVDDGTVVRFEQVSYLAAALLVSLTVSRRANKIITLNGTDHAVELMIEAAARENIDVCFRDPAQEAERQRLRTEFARQEAAMPLAVFIAERNASPLERLPYRAWTADDAGEAQFAGLARLADDAQLLLLRKNDAVLVMPVTGTEAAGLRECTLGETIAVAPGRVAPQGQRQ